MDQRHPRFEALERQVQTLHQQTRTVNRRLRWWRGTALLLLGLGLVSWPLSRATLPAQVNAATLTLEQRVAALEAKLKYLTTRIDSSGRPLMEIAGANLRLVNGLGRTDCGTEEKPIPGCPNGLGNLIVGYNESRQEEENIRIGSHNVVVGREHNYARFGGLVVGLHNTISGGFAAVSGGWGNTASGQVAAVSGGSSNTASGEIAVVSGGIVNTASGLYAVVSGGSHNTASSSIAVVSGGAVNTASGHVAAVSGGVHNTASGFAASVSGGQQNTASGGDEDAELVGGAVSGGFGNTASGEASVVSGGQNRTAAGEFDWVAGSLVEDD